MAAANKGASPAPTPKWRVYGATSIGATHVSTGRPPEDALGVRPPSAVEQAEEPVAVAVSDGHGHARHFRSERGAELAVEVATRAGLAAAAAARTLADAAAVDRLWREHAGRDLIKAWRDAVQADVRARPITDAERAAGGLAANAGMDEIIFAYGATLILAVGAGPWLLTAQIGDGDMFSISDSGGIAALVPSDPRLDGSRTTSLCQPDAVASMRYGVALVPGSPTAAVMMATDGYGNAQARDDWDAAFGRDIEALAAARGEDWIGEQLPRWAAKCASFEGSGDDVTVALMFVSGTRWQSARAGSGAAAPTPVPATPVRVPADETTVNDEATTPDLPVLGVPAARAESARPARSPASAALSATLPMDAPAAGASAAGFPAALAPAAGVPARPAGGHAGASNAAPDAPAGKSSHATLIWLTSLLVVVLIAAGVLVYEFVR